VNPTATQLKKKKKTIFISTVLSLYGLLAPAIILLFVFHYIPMYGIIIAFEDFSPFKGFIKSTWVGLKHFQWFLKEPKFWVVMKNTLILNAYDIMFGFTAPIVFALLANEIVSKAFKRTMQTISYLPHFLSWIVVSGFVYQLLSPTTGMINSALVALFGIKPIFFMTELSMFRTIVVITEIWKGVGWSAILYFSVIAGIDPQLYDAAMIDGAGRLKQTGM
jgi:putative aldouronate transport system permease protein